MINITITITITNTITIAICFDLMLKLNLLVANTYCLSNLPLNRYYTHTDLYIYIRYMSPILDIYIYCPMSLRVSGRIFGESFVRE